MFVFVLIGDECIEKMLDYVEVSVGKWDKVICNNQS